MKLFRSKKDMMTKILLVIFWPIGIATFIVWSIKKLICMAERSKYEEALAGERARLSLVLAGVPCDDALSYIGEGTKLDFEFSDNSDIHTVKSGNDYIGYIDRRDVKAFEKFSPTEAYIEKFGYTDEKPVVTALFFV